MSKTKGVILIVPCIEKGRGGGHLVRSLILTRELRENGRNAFLFIDDEGNKTRTIDVTLIVRIIGDFDALWICREPPPEINCIIIDGFRASQEEFEKWSRLAPVVGIDEGGDYRDGFDFLVDLLPGIMGRPNITAPGFLPLPKNRRNDFDDASLREPRILISFGMEDEAGLGASVAESLGIAMQEKVPDLREHLAEYDLVITHFGITAFEALYAGVPVLLVSPTPYHEKLARRAGFVSAGIGKKAASRIGYLVYSHSDGTVPRVINKQFFNNLIQQNEYVFAKYFDNADNSQSNIGTSSGDFFSAISPMVSLVCRGCGFPVHKTAAIARFTERTYRRCKNCGLIGMDRLTLPPFEYDKDYFFDSYKKQYGKTYLEDFPSLVEAGKRRLKIIKSLLDLPPGQEERTHARLLDIGCAYGPFLAAAREEGFTPEGIEPAEDAARYVNQELGISCRHGFFPLGPDAGRGRVPEDGAFDAVTFWYVIEHFEDCQSVLAEANRVLKKGGVLAFSTPSLTGVSGRKSLNNFLKNSPADHFTVWSPSICKKLLKKHGFTLKKIVVTGHHPERFPLIGKHLKGKGFFFKLFMAVSKLFNLGDSFEAYALK